MAKGPLRAHPRVGLRPVPGVIALGRAVRVCVNRTLCDQASIAKSVNDHLSALNAIPYGDLFRSLRDVRSASKRCTLVTPVRCQSARNAVHSDDHRRVSARTLEPMASVHSVGSLARSWRGELPRQKPRTTLGRLGCRRRVRRCAIPPPSVRLANPERRPHQEADTTGPHLIRDVSRPLTE